MRYETKKCNGGWFWRIVADNRKVLANSRIYKSKRTCVLSMEDVKRRSMYCEARVEK